MQCDVCDYEVTISEYGNGTCPHCGQEYEYEEGLMIVLTKRQKIYYEKKMAVKGLCKGDK